MNPQKAYIAADSSYMNLSFSQISLSQYGKKLGLLHPDRILNGNIV
jgi:hypothetical protein